MIFQNQVYGTLYFTNEGTQYNNMIPAIYGSLLLLLYFPELNTRVNIIIIIKTIMLRNIMALVTV